MKIVAVVFLGAVAGLLAAFVMNLFMRSVASKWGKRGDMVRALGGFFSKDKENAASLGTAIHGGGGLFFGAVYFVVLHLMGALVLPYSLFLGLAFGFIHGLLMSYLLMYYASERHPDKEYRKATMEEGVVHLFGHVIFGAVLGLIGGALGLGFGG